MSGVPVELGVAPVAAREAPRLAAVIAVCLGGAAVTLDATLLNSIFPAVLAAFDRDVSVSAWVVNASNLALSATLVLGGPLADALGRRRVYLASTLAFAGLCLASALVPQFWPLLLLRTGVGIAGALLMVCSLALLSDVVPPQRRPAAVGLYGALSGVASLVGPLVGTLVLEWGRWPLGWLACALAGLVAFALTRHATPAAAPPRRARVRVDWLRGALAGLALAALVFLLSGTRDTGQVGFGPWGLVGVALAFGYVAYGELRTDTPLFPRALRSLAYAHALIGILGLAVAFGAALLAIPLFVTQAQGGRLSAGGLALVPPAVASIGAALAAGRLAARRSYRLTGALGMGLTLAGLSAMVTWTELTSFVAVCAWGALAGAGLGAGIPSMAGYSLQQVDDAHAGAASAWYQGARQLGVVLGVALFAVVLTQVRGTHAASDARVREQLVSAAGGRYVPLWSQVRGCPSVECVDARLADLASAPRVEAVLRAGHRSEFAAAFRAALAWVAGVVALCSGLWLLLLPATRRRAGSPTA